MFVYTFSISIFLCLQQYIIYIKIVCIFRLKILKLLEIVHDDAISAATNDGTILNFFEDCMRSVETSSMKWIAPTTCIDNLQMLTDIEHQILSNEQKLDEDTVNCVLALLARLYKLTAVIPCQNVQMVLIYIIICMHS